MRDNILIGLILLVLVLSMVEVATKKDVDRYSVITGSNMMTILLDKKTGTTWRNCICSENSNVPGCWERMYTVNPEEYSKPQGEVNINRKLVKDMQKQQKLQAKQQAAQPVQQVK